MRVFRRRLEALPAHKRPRIVPEDRFEVLQLMRLRGLSVEQAAERYVLHPNTIRDWIRQFRTGRDVGAFFGKAPFNKISDAGRWLALDIINSRRDKTSLRRRESPLTAAFNPPRKRSMPRSGILSPHCKMYTKHLDMRP